MRLHPLRFGKQTERNAGVVTYAKNCLQPPCRRMPILIDGRTEVRPPASAPSDLVPRSSGPSRLICEPSPPMSRRRRGTFDDRNRRPSRRQGRCREASTCVTIRNPILQNFWNRARPNPLRLQHRRFLKGSNASRWRRCPWPSSHSPRVAAVVSPGRRRPSLRLLRVPRLHQALRLRRRLRLRLVPRPLRVLRPHLLRVLPLRLRPHPHPHPERHRRRCRPPASSRRRRWARAGPTSR